MKNRRTDVIGNLLFYIPFLMFLLYTNIHFLFAMRSNSELISMIINLFNKLYMNGPYVFFVISFILAIYIFRNGTKKHKLIVVITTIGCFLMSYRLLIDATTKSESLTALMLASSYLIGIFYTLSLFIYLKDKKTEVIKKKLTAAAKLIVIYIGTIFVLATLSNTSQYSYASAEQGVTAWFRSTNALGHSLVFLLPLFVILYLKNKKNNYLLYIVAIGTLDLLIGTKACYYGWLSTLFVTVIYLFVDVLKSKKYHHFKLLSLAIILAVSIFISNDLSVTNNIRDSVKHNTNEQNQIDVINFVVSDRYDNVNTIKPFFKESNTFTKIFGLGLYYPRFDFMYVELDLLDLLYSRGIYGFTLYITIFGIIIFKMIRKSFTKIKKHFDIDILLMLLTLGYIGFASLFVGHVLFNLMPLTVAIMIITCYIFISNKKHEK